MAQIEIDGKKIEANAGEMLIEVADACGISIPRFCYHKKLSIAANCRMCLVEVEKSAKPLPACATPVTDGMKVWTKSKVSLDAQRSVMEFLLINHPLDCPICDQGGECELQDLAMGYGRDISRFNEGKRVIKDKNIGPLIATDMTRCIQCTRCVRFGTEVAGLRELGATGRGEHMQITTFIEQNVTSEVSGNIIDLCPVGALTSKPFRFKARAWELTEHKSIAPHDCVGSNIYIHSRRQEVLRVVPKANESINEVWLSDRDRFSYEGVYHKDRLKTPKIGTKDKDWTEAFLEAVSRIQDCISKYGPEAIAGLIAPTATLEECYLFQKLLRGLGCHNIDYRLRQQDFRADIISDNLSIAKLEKASVILLIGSYIHKEQPILGLRVRSAVENNRAQVLVVNPIDFAFHFDVAEKIIVDSGNIVGGLALLVLALLDALPNAKERESIQQFVSMVTEVKPGSVHHNMAKILLSANSENSVNLLLGANAIQHPDYSIIYRLSQIIKGLIQNKNNVTLTVLTDGPNSIGASIAKAEGMPLPEMLQKPIKCFVLFGFAPECDSIFGQHLLQALKKAETVIECTTFHSNIPNLIQNQTLNHILLPITPFTETNGTFVNVEGQWQSFNAAVMPLEESRPGWKVLRVFGNLCLLEGFEYEASEEILAEVKMMHENTLQTMDRQTMDRSNTMPLSIKELINPNLLQPSLSKPRLSQPKSSQKAATLTRVAPIPLYASDCLTRHSIPLQETEDAKPPKAVIHPKTAEKLNLLSAEKIKVVNGDSVILPLALCEKIPFNSILIEGGWAQTVVLGLPYDCVEIAHEK